MDKKDITLQKNSVGIPQSHLKATLWEVCFLNYLILQPPSQG